jgi:hypothetical protein
MSKLRRPNTSSRLTLDDLPELASLGQFGQVIGLTDGQVRTIIRTRRIPYVEIGRRLFVPKAAIPRFPDEPSIAAAGAEAR